MALSFGSKRTVNIIFNDHSIRYLELKSVNPPVPLRWGDRFLPPGIIEDGKIADFESLTNILDECIREWKIKRRNVNFIIPDPLVIIRKISIQSNIEDDEIQSHLYMELGASIHLPFNDPVFDVYPLGERDGKKELLLFASPEKFVMEYSDLLAGLKLNPVAADISPLALYRLYHAFDKAKKREGLFAVQVNLTSVTMCIFEEHVPFYMRHFPLDFEMESWEIRMGRKGSCEYIFTGDPSQLGGHFSNLYMEMIKFMDFYRYSAAEPKLGISRILLDGDHPMLDQICKGMKEQFEFPIETLPWEENQASRKKIIPPRQKLLFGLALKEVK